MPGQKPRTSGPVVPKPLKWHGFLTAWIIFVVLRLNMMTWRICYEDAAGILEKKPEKPYLWAIWHGDLAISMVVYDQLRKNWGPDTRLVAMVSASGDGSLITKVLGLFKVRCARGSTSRRGPQALLELTTAIEEGFHAAITPDGPRGPSHTVHDGILALARVTGRPIIPVSVSISRKTNLKSWDRFQIPWPFTRCDIRLGRTLIVPSGSDPATRQKLAAELKSLMAR